MKIGLTNGCFDALHDGHRLFLSAASNQCDYLIVAVNSDASVKRLKGDGRPIFTLEDRMMALMAMCSADVAAIIPFDGNVASLLMAIHPDVVIRGHDQTIEGHTFAKIIRLARFGTESTTGNLDAKSRLS